MNIEGTNPSIGPRPFLGVVIKEHTMTTKKLKDAKLAASKTANTTPKAAPKKMYFKKKPTKAELRRKAAATALSKAKKRVKDLKKAKSEQAWIDTECRKVQKGDNATLTLGVYMNERYQAESRKLGFLHWTLVTEASIPNTVSNDTKKVANAKDLLKRIEWDLGRMQESLYEAWLAGYGGSENTSREIGKIRDKAYAVVFGANPPRRAKGEHPYSNLINAGKAVYKKLVNLDTQTDGQAKDASVVGGMLTHFKVDLTKINVNGNG